MLVDGQCGRKVLLKEGILHGGVLQPNIFILYMDDIIPELPKVVHTSHYADDFVLWCTEEYAITANYRMQIALDKVVT